MTDRENLLRAVVDEPESDAPRMVYADYLEEYGDEQDRLRAEFIRVQCRLHELGPKPLRTDSLKRWINPLANGRWEWDVILSADDREEYVEGARVELKIGLLRKKGSERWCSFQIEKVKSVDADDEYGGRRCLVKLAPCDPYPHRVARKLQKRERELLGHWNPVGLDDLWIDGLIDWLMMFNREFGTEHAVDLFPHLFFKSIFLRGFIHSFSLAIEHWLLWGPTLVGKIPVEPGRRKDFLRFYGLIFSREYGGGFGNWAVTKKDLGPIWWVLCTDKNAADAAAFLERPDRTELEQLVSYNAYQWAVQEAEKHAKAVL